MEKIRVLMITSTPPVPTWGGAMTFYRHFCERNDFSVAVITDDEAVKQHPVDYPYIVVNHGRLWKRLSVTRLNKLPHTYSKIAGARRLHASVLEFAKSFQPQVVFTVAGSWSWMAVMAGDIAKKLGIPLVGSFNDWWFYNSIYYTASAGILEKKYKAFYRRCDLALCTSEGMKEEMGPHKNAIVLYPTGSELSQSSFKPTPSGKKFRLAFAGNLGDWYGLMLEQLVRSAEGADIEFVFFGSNQSWSDEFHQYCLANGMFRGQVPFKRLEKEMEQVDALLLLMGFDANCAQIEKTSFKTKFLDYLSFSKPILLWGPKYCSAVRIANEFDSAEICTTEHAGDFLEKILAVKSDPARQETLVRNARNMYEGRFHPDKIHAELVKGISGVINSWTNA